MLLFEYTNISYDTDLLIRSKLFLDVVKKLEKSLVSDPVIQSFGIRNPIR